MPASMISAVAGCRAKVDGSSRAMAPTGPMPGSTPTIVPTSTPTKHASRLPGIIATPNPYMRPSIGPTLSSPAAGQRDVEEHGEQDVRRRRADDADERGGRPAAPEESQHDRGEQE